MNRLSRRLLAAFDSTAGASLDAAALPNTPANIPPAMNKCWPSCGA